MLSKIFQRNGKDKKQLAQVEQSVYSFLSSYQSQVFPYGLLAVCQLKSVDVEKQVTYVELEVPFPCQSELAEVSTLLTESLGGVVEIKPQLNVISIKKHEISGVKNIIAISSGKGGVGKSTTAVNLAYALIDEGAHVGILDADIYGPSIPTLLALQGQKTTSADGALLTPMDAHGLSAMSIGFLVEDSEATVWRGPMASKAFGQLLNETAWNDIDYLIVDMPPGTGDIQLTLAQKVPVAASVVVTTPQDLALADAIKGVAMFEKVNVPVLGVIENMSYHLCESCGHQSDLFGSGGGDRISKQYNVSLLGQLPLDIQIREEADNGNSPLLSNSAGEVAKQYRKIATNIVTKLFDDYDPRSPQTSSILIKEI